MVCFESLFEIKCSIPLVFVPLSLVEGDTTIHPFSLYIVFYTIQDDILSQNVFRKINNKFYTSVSLKIHGTYV